MERQEYIHEFEDFLQEHADMHKLYPSDKVWNAIHRRLHPKPKWPYVFAAAVMMGLGIAGSVHDKQFVHNPSSITVQPLAKVIPIPSTLQADKTFAVENNSFTKTAVKTSSSATGELFVQNQPVVLEALKNDSQAVLKKSPVALSNAATPEPTLENVVVQAISDDSRPLTEENIAEATLQMATLTRLPVRSLAERSPAVNDVLSRSTSSVKTSRALKFGWQLYASPTISYRRLSGKGLAYYNNAGNSMSSVFSTANVANSVTHKPSIGFELGSALTYAVSTSLKVKAGVQFNVNRYDVQAFHSVPEVAPMTRNAGADGINVVSTFRNYSGFSKTWLRNQHIMMALPVGAEWSLFGNENIRFNIGATLQPTFVVNNQAYMISTNMRNYAKAPSLYREFNLAAGAEMFVSIKGRSLRYNIGPQLRYQLFSSYKRPYPISEFLTDYGLKVSIGR
jgi:hypothetical protein